MTTKFHSSSDCTLVAFIHERLDREFSKKKIKQALEKKGCRVNGRLETFASRKLKKGDEVDFDTTLLVKKDEVVIFEDDHMRVIDKAPFRIISQENFVGFHIVHRLDKETSGLLLLAKSEQMKKGLEKLFYDRKIEKCYHAIVKGKAKACSGVIDKPIFLVSKSKGKKVMGVEGLGDALKAQTRYTILKQMGPYSLVECHPRTGRTHQIRVHLESIGLSIVGDSQYGSAKEEAKRMMLHCSELKFIHPITNEALTLKAEWPDDFKNFNR